MNAAAPGLELIEAIRAVAELEYYGAPHTSSASRAPIVVWRYVEADDTEHLAAEIAQCIEDAIDGRNVEWELRRPGRNWLLAPKRYLDLEDSKRFRTYAQILRYLEKTDPELGRMANRDLHEVATKVGLSLRKLLRGWP